MALQYIISAENDFSHGIDARSAENQISPGFVKDLLNADVVEKRVRKRRGYQGYAGDVPVRVTRLDYIAATNQACFTLDSAVSLDTTISLESVRSSPIVVYGRSSNQVSGPFTNSTDSVKYYNLFTVPVRKAMTAGTGTIVIPATEHGFGTTNLFIRIVEATSLTDRSYLDVETDQISISESTFDVTISYTSAVDREVFIYFADQTPVAGNSYVATLTHTGSGSESFSVPTASHNLTNYNVVAQLQRDDGTSRSWVDLEAMTLASTGDITATIISDVAATFYLILTAAPIPNTVSGVIGAMSSGTVTISSPTKPWCYFGVYLETSVGGDKEMVLADSIAYDSVSNQVTVTFQNSTSSAKNFTVFYSYGDVRSNRLCVTDASVVADGTDLAPQLTMWGLIQEEIYPVKTLREGWVNHIDSYRRSGEQRLMAGLGGNLFSAKEYSEAASAYAYPTLYPRLFARANSNVRLGPVFWDTGEVPARTRGYVTCSSSGSHWVTVSAVAYDTGTGFTKYTLSVPNKQVLDSSGVPTTLGTVIATSGNLNDFLTVQGMSFSRHNGTFRIRQIVDGTDQIEISVENSQNSSDYDDSGVAGEAGIFTDQLQFTAMSPFIPADALISSAIADTVITQVVSTSDSISVINGLTDLLEIPAGVLFNASRTSRLMPLREGTPSLANSVTNLVRGDMLSYTGIPRLLRVLYINPDSDQTLDLVGDGTTVTATMTSGATTFVTAGQKVLLLDAGVYTGVQTIDAVTSGSEFTFSSTETDSVTGATLAGATVELDEELEWQDSAGDQVAVRVEERWIPVEAPDDSFDLTPSTHVRYFDTNAYSGQSFLRSTMVNDNLYLTNYDDSVHKFEGSNLYRAGLPTWQPGLFATQENTGARIVSNLRSLAYSAISASEGKLTITAATTNSIPVGTEVLLSGSTETYTIREYSDDGTNFYVLMTKALDSSVSATGTIKEIGTYRYYFRLNAVDINDNIIASAATSSQDFVVQVVEDVGIQLKLVGIPTLDNYDYDRLEVQIYRTKMNQAAPFYLITTIPMDFDNTQGYITYLDSFADSDLTQLDIVNTALKGQELGTSWDSAPRAKYLTTIGNKLVLGNLKDYPELDLQIVGNANLGNSDIAGGKVLLRRDATDAATTTDMINRVTYEWINGFTGDVSNFTIGSDDISLDTSVNTGASPGDWIYLTYSTVATTGRQLNYSGWYQIASVSGATVTINVVGAASAASYPNKYVIATNTKDVPVLLGVDGNLGMFNGDSFDTFDAMRRMALAINASMRMVDISISGMEEFTPWITTRGGNDLAPAGRLLIRFPQASLLTPSITPTFSVYSLFINSIRRASGDTITASTKIYPSRIAVSYENYPEIFDNVGTILDTDSDSVIDINPADGQQITGVLPFFGEAAFTAAQQAAILVVFKTNSIYLVDLNQKAQGLPAVQRIETEGLGCTAPYSIAVTKKGIMFANESGIYCLRRDQSIQYIGKYMERNWVENVDISSLDLVQGHHYGVGRVYKLSVPYTSTADATTGYIENSQVFVYNHTSEDEGQPLGAWSRYDNHPAIGWANLGAQAFFASTLGRVFSIRTTGTDTDFRDDNEGIDLNLQTRHSDFGASGIRKVVDKIVVHYRAGATNTGTSLSYSPDTENEYQTTVPFTLNQPTSNTGIDDMVGKKITSIRHNVGRRRCEFMSVQIENTAMDENVEVAGIDFVVGGLDSKGIRQAGQTK